MLVDWMGGINECGKFPQEIGIRFIAMYVIILDSAGMLAGGESRSRRLISDNKEAFISQGRE